MVSPFEVWSIFFGAVTPVTSARVFAAETMPFASRSSLAVR